MVPRLSLRYEYQKFSSFLRLKKRTKPLQLKDKQENKLTTLSFTSFEFINSNMGKFIILVHANADAEAGKEPPIQEMIDMGAFNTELTNSGVLLAADGLTESAKGARVTFSDTNPQVQNGPFPLENLVARFWVLKLDSLEEAVAWAKKIPFKTGSVEIRKIADPEDFSAEFNILGVGLPFLCFTRSARDLRNMSSVGSL